jgi:hypothetical protein
MLARVMGVVNNSIYAGGSYLVSRLMRVCHCYARFRASYRAIDSAYPLPSINKICLCCTLPFFVGGVIPGVFLFCANLIEIFGRGQECGTVMTAFALMTPGKLEKEHPTRSIQPRHPLPSRTINLIIAAVRTAFQSNSTQKGTAPLLVAVLCE